MTRTFVIVLMALAFIVGIAMDAHLQEPAQTPKSGWTSESISPKVRKEKDERQKQHQTPSDKTLARNQAKSPNFTTPTQQRDQEIQIEDRLVRFTGLLVLVGAIQAIVLIGQSFLFYCQFRAGQLSARAALRSVRAAQRSSRVAELALRSSRPYLFVAQIHFDSSGNVYDSGIEWPSHDSRLTSTISLTAPIVTFENYGQSPAIIKTLFASFEPFECSNFDVIQHDSHDGLEQRLFDEGGDRFIREGRTFDVVVFTKFTKGWTITEEQFEKMRSLEWALVAYGRVEYGDVFSPQSVYRTDFCWTVQLDFDVTDHRPNTIRFFWVGGPTEHNRHT